METTATRTAAPARAEATQRAKRHWSIPRVATGSILAAWAIMFWFVLFAGRSYLFLASRTAWVIPVGAVLLTIAAIGRLASARSSVRERLSRREAVILALFLIPVALVMILPPQTLGAFAVSRRPAFGTGVASSADDIATGSLTLLEVAGAQATRKGLDALALRAGEPVSFVGFITREPGQPANEFYLNRFIVSCCAADAQGAYIRVVDAPPSGFAENQWVQVDGTIYPLGRDVILVNEGMKKVPVPDQPYLSAGTTTQN